MYEGHWFGGGFMWIFWIAVILVIIFIVKMSTGSVSGMNNPVDKRKTALEILQERYARGEIEKKEFEQKKNDLL